MTRTFESLLCSEADLAVADDQRGSAATFDRYLLIEHHAAFGRDAATDAVRAVYGAETDDVLAIDGLRPFAIRPIGRAGTGGSRPGFIGRDESGGSRPRFVGRTGTRGSLVELDAAPSVDDLRAPDIVTRSTAEPLFAVCTNGSRDRCCAIKGRDLSAGLHRTLDDPEADARVVEISHLGGHRFAPTMLVLPWGYSYGRLDLDSALEIAYAAQDGLIHPEKLRGRADLPPAAQVADTIWRTELGPAPITAVEILRSEFHDGLHTVSALVQGREEHLRLRSSPGPVIDATACGGKPIAAVDWQISARGPR